MTLLMWPWWVRIPMRWWIWWRWCELVLPLQVANLRLVAPRRKKGLKTASPSPPPLSTLWQMSRSHPHSEQMIFYTVLVGLGWGELRVLDHRPASRNFSLAPKICLRTLTSHQKELFQRKETLHNLMCTGKFTQTGATLTVFFIKGARDEAPLTTIFSLVQYLL